MSVLRNEQINTVSGVRTAELFHKVKGLQTDASWTRRVGVTRVTRGYSGPEHSDTVFRNL